MGWWLLQLTVPVVALEFETYYIHLRYVSSDILVYDNLYSKIMVTQQKAH